MTLSIPILDLSLASSRNPQHRQQLLQDLHSALFTYGFLYIKNHGVPQSTIDDLYNTLPALFALPEAEKLRISKINSPHFLGYNGYAEESTLGQKDLREQFDFGTELPVVYDAEAGDAGTDDGRQEHGRDMSKLYWRLRGPNQWPDERLIPGFCEKLTRYHDAVAELSYRLVHLVEEAFGIEVGTFDHFFSSPSTSSPTSSLSSRSEAAEPRCSSNGDTSRKENTALRPQHRIKLLRYPPVPPTTSPASPEHNLQGVGPHKDSSGWLTFLYQGPHPEGGLFVQPPPNDSSNSSNGEWLPVAPIENTFVINTGNAFEAATSSAIRATIHKVDAPCLAMSPARCSIPFFMGLPLDLSVSEIRDLMPEPVKEVGRSRRGRQGARAGGDDGGVSAFLDPRWDGLGESQLRKWIRSHEDVGRRWYGDEVVGYYTS